jgi:hypothetical protein
MCSHVLAARTQVVTALAVAQQALQRREATTPRALAAAAERQGRPLFLVPEVRSLYCPHSGVL